jgi:hypothetical protein
MVEISDGTGGFPEGVPVKTEKLGKEPIVRSVANQTKVDGMKDMLTYVIKDEEVDAFFLEVMGLAAKLGYRLQAEPKLLLAQIDKAAETGA